MSQKTSNHLMLPGQSGLSVALVEPRIPQNTGTITRLCACTGTELYLVGNLGFIRSDRHMKRAAMDYGEQAHVHELPDFEALQQAKPGARFVYLTTKARQSLWDVAFEPNTVLVFGNETHGLPEPWLAAHEDDCFRIPMVDGVRSLNLAVAVSITLYHALYRLQLDRRVLTEHPISQSELSH